MNKQKNVILAPKWLNVRIEVLLHSSAKKKEIEKKAQEIYEIVINTHCTYTLDGKYLGATNPKIGINTLMTVETFGNEMIRRKLSLPYNYNLKKEGDHWRIIIFPINPQSHKQDMYSLELLSYDVDALLASNRWIAQKYGIKLGEHPDRAIFIPDILDNQLHLTMHHQLIVIDYFMLHRLEFQQRAPEIDRNILGMGMGTAEDLLDFIVRQEKESPVGEKAKELLANRKKPSIFERLAIWRY